MYLEPARLAPIVQSSGSLHLPAIERGDAARAFGDTNKGYEFI